MYLQAVELSPHSRMCLLQKRKAASISSHHPFSQQQPRTMCTQVFVWACVQMSWIYICRHGLAKSCNHRLMVQRTRSLFCKATAQPPVFTSRVCVSASSITLVIICLPTIPVSAVVSYCLVVVWVCIFLTVNAVPSLEK